jgi:CzcA family heavy metal efflux pump
MQDGLATFGLRHQKTLLFVVVVLTALGVWAYAATPASIFPNMSFARIDVVVDAGDLPPERVRLGVAQPLERAFLGLPAVTRVTATSAQGNVEVLVDFESSSDARFDLQYVDQAIAQARAVLPSDVSTNASIVTPTSEVVLAYAFQSDSMSTTVLREFTERSLVPEFYGVPGLARMAVMGGRRREFAVTLDPASLAARRITAGDVGRAIADANDIAAVGVRQQYYQRNVLLLDSTVQTADELADLQMPDADHNPVRLSALGTVGLGVAPAETAASYNGRKAVVLSFYALPGADAVKMSDEIKRRMAGVARRIPAGVTLSRAWDQTDLVVASQRNLRDAILVGAFLAILVILVFLQDLRMTVVAALIIPVAIAVTLVAINRLGETLNLMSVGGLAVAVGLIIDDAIVVVENISRHLRIENAPVAAVSAAMRELIAPMTASTLTTVVVFVPLTLLSGIPGFFFRSLALTLSSALTVSLLLALFVAPVLAGWLIRPREQRPRRDLAAALVRGYEPVLRYALDHRAVVYAACALVLVATGALLTRLPSDFLPDLDEGQLQIDYRMPVGTTLAASDAAATRMEQLVLADPAVSSVVRLTGIDPNGFSPIAVREGKLRIRLRPETERAPYRTVIDRLRTRLSAAVPASDLEFTQLLEEVLGDLTGSPQPIAVTIVGPEQRTLVAVATELADRLAKVHGLSDVFSGVAYDDPTANVEPDQARLASLGLTKSELGTYLESGAQGFVAADVPSAAAIVTPVRVRVLGGDLFATPQGFVAANTLARVGAARPTTDVSELNGQRTMTVTAGLEGDLSTAIAGVRKALAATRLPPGYTVTIGGAYQEQQQSFGEFVLVIGIAVLLVYVVMLATFRSFRLPLVILTAIPLALIGVALALTVTRTPVNVSSYMGLLLLVGIVVKNGILLVDAANRRRVAGASVRDALLDAGRVRLRPIVMTTFAAIGGLLPLAFGIGAGAAMERPLAIAVIGGLSTATAFTLIAIPVLYAGIAGRRAAA